MTGGLCIFLGWVYLVSFIFTYCATAPDGPERPEPMDTP